MWKVAGIIVLFLTPVFGEQPSEHASCLATSASAPRFAVGRKTVNGKAQAVVLNVSVNRKDGSKEKVVALACKLTRDYDNQRTLVVWFFTSLEAAKQFRTSGEGVSVATKKSLMASYRSEPAQNVHELTWTPNGREPADSTKILLNVSR